MNDVFKALSDSSRRKILELLYDSDLSAGEISEYFDMQKPSVSHHLNILKNADLVVSERHGQKIIYSLNTTSFQNVVKWFLDISKKEEKNEEK